VATLSYSAKARADLSDIWLAIATSNGVQLADDILDRIRTRADALCDHPELGPNRPEIAPKARSLLIERWLILYRIDAEAIGIIRILDGARDLRNLTDNEFPAD
jgi:toxin ParE1/3/4